MTMVGNIGTFTTIFVTELGQKLIEKGVLTQEEMHEILDNTHTTMTELSQKNSPIIEQTLN